MAPIWRVIPRSVPLIMHRKFSLDSSAKVLLIPFMTFVNCTQQTLLNESKSGNLKDTFLPVDIFVETARYRVHTQCTLHSAPTLLYQIQNNLMVDRCTISTCKASSKMCVELRY